MVRAILAGKKSQTRRIVQSPARNMQREGMEVIKYRPPGDAWYKDHVWSMRGRTGVWGDYTDTRFKELCPYGAPGDRLWVRETWALLTGNGHRVVYRADGEEPRTGWDDVAEGLRPRMTWRPSIFMRRHHSRITLEVTDVRVERLRAITEEDAVAEGVDLESAGANYRLANGQVVARSLYSDLWDSINAKRGSWKDNPWVFVIEFRRAA